MPNSTSMRSAVSTHVCGVGIALALSLSSLLAATQEPATPDSARAVVDTYCIGCHSERLQTAGLVLEGLSPENIGTHAEVWEKVLRKVRAGAMPPAAHMVTRP